MKITQSDLLILECITQAAEAGKACPGNTELAELTNVASRATPARAVQRLEDMGFIEVTRTRSTRVVTITATGATTAGHTTVLHQRQGDARAQRLDRIAQEMSEGSTLTAIAARLGVSMGRVSQHWREICAGLGRQAI